MPVASAAIALLAASTVARARATQEEFFRSLQENVDNASSNDSGLILLLVIAAVLLVGAVLALGSRQKHRVVKPKTLNHSRRLVREVARATRLKRWEMKQLKTASDDQQISSPLTLLICPSLLVKSVSDPQPGARADRRALAQIARKLAGR